MEAVVYCVLCLSLLVLHLSLPLRLHAASTPFLQCLKSPQFLPFFVSLPSFLSSSNLGHTVTSLYTGAATSDSQQHAAPAQLFCTGTHSTPVTWDTHPLCAPVRSNCSRGWIGRECVGGIRTWLHLHFLDICACVYVCIV